MNIVEAIILGLVQGLTEFIPVSSSGHLLLLHRVFGVTENGLGFDVALHIGTLAALLVFFYQDGLELLQSITKRGPKSRLAWLIIIATIPAVVAGFLLQNAAETSFRSAKLVAITLGLMGLVMLLAEYVGRRNKTIPVEKISLKQGSFIGLIQAVALIPGISRSGSTISAGLFAGLDRVTATRFSFLLSIPITFGAILKFTFDGDTLKQVGQQTDLFIVGIITAFFSGLFAIRFLIRYLSKHGLHIFAYYRLALAASILVLVLLN